ncbi:hypothetical protein HU200_046406 [Digitaria exilis]|uniref:Uncharacterized protein n=1 Tax=Digitaria exilis TaxID=1010633 RepID=A0A835AZ24_9POAL|nr:hypothetical protein HU200_046406 [Digitaria exilis]
MSPLDEQGHGSHTASTAAGRAVGNVSFGGGLAAGTTRGAVPGARLAIYKVCWDSACREMDILAAFDDAVADGIDVISMSIATRFPSLYFKSAEAISSFHAMRRGVVTSAAAGNSGLSGGRLNEMSDLNFLLGLIFSNPVGTIERTDTTVNPQALIAASFSSPGPNQITPEILKGYNATQFALITGSNTMACATNGSTVTSSAGDLNYPSMATLVEPGKNFTVAFPRTLTNVGDSASAMYNVNILLSATGKAADHLAVLVAPSRLEFNAQNGQKASFTVTVCLV